MLGYTKQPRPKGFKFVTLVILRESTAKGFSTTTNLSGFWRAADSDSIPRGRMEEGGGRREEGEEGEEGGWRRG
jgi:hypothetical protein